LSNRALFYGWRRLNNFKLVVFDLLHARSQHFDKHWPAAIDLAQTGVAAALGNGNQVSIRST
jgi:hypothetical protein